MARPFCVSIFALSFVFGAAVERPIQAAPAVSVPRITHPGAGQVLYFVLTDRFANGRTENDRGGMTGGPDQHGFDPTRISHFHGGDFAGLTSGLDYLKDLGVTSVWVTPPFRNKPVQQGTAGYHGYWVLDFLAIDPHLGTDEEFREFVRQAHARGLRVIMDIIVNHTADVIGLQGDHSYKDRASRPYRDAAGRPFDERVVAFNGLNDASAFPALAADRSFPYSPVVPAAEAAAKNPAWLNDVRLYHNRGNSTFAGENSVHGDFVGLDDLFTEHPKVVEGFVEVFRRWIEDCGVDGFRIDTARHVNSEFWQAFIPAIREHARAIGRPDFIQFGEVYNDAGDPAVLSEFSTNTVPIDTTLDFGFFVAARRYVSQGGTAAALADFFARDDYYTDHDGNVHATTTFLGNHDAGRFAYFLQQDNPGVSFDRLADLVRFGHGLLYLARGQPVIYYGDEQGLIGRGGNDMQARESLFAAQAPDFRDATLLGTARTGADDKFDTGHPFFRFFRSLGRLRAAHAALRTGAMVPRLTAEPAVFAFSRIERREREEMLVVMNNSRTAAITTRVPTGQPAKGAFMCVFDSSTPDDAGGRSVFVDDQSGFTVTLAPLQFSVWRATAPLGAVRQPARIALVSPESGANLNFQTREIDGLVFPTRREIRAEVVDGDGLAEVTFTLTRASRPGQFEILGTDDSPPYRVFWSPPPDLGPDEELTFIATVSDLRGGLASSAVSGVRVTPDSIRSGIRGAVAPKLTKSPRAEARVHAGSELRLQVEASGTAPLTYQWIRDDVEVIGATAPVFRIDSAQAPDAGRYSVVVRNRAGSVVSSPVTVSVE